MVEFCWDWKIDYAFLKKAHCFVPSTNRFYRGWLRLCLCRIGTNNMSALIFPPFLDSPIVWTFVIWAPECQLLALRFKIHKQAKEPKSNWNHTDSNIVDCMSKTETGMFQPNLFTLETRKLRSREKWLVALWAIPKKWCCLIPLSWVHKAPIQQKCYVVCCCCFKLD